MSSGLYIVTLNNPNPISVNANDLRRAERCIKVNQQNCKIGKAMNFAGRQRNYFRVFGQANVNFYRIAALANPKTAESAILASLGPNRIRGITNRANEWLQRIAPLEVMRIALRTLDEAGFRYEPLEGIEALAEHYGGAQGTG